MDMKTFKTAGVVEILLYLKDHPKGARRVAIRTDTGINPTTMAKAVPILIAHELVFDTFYMNGKVLSLTDKGAVLAGKVAEIATMLSGIDEKTSVKALLSNDTFEG